MSTQAGYGIKVQLTNASGEIRDLGAGQTKQGGEVTADVTKSRPASGEDIYVWAAPPDTDNITVAFEAWKLRPNYTFADACVGRGKASLTLVRFDEDFKPVENVWVKSGKLMKLGDIETDANKNDMAVIELEFVIGKIA